MKKLLSLFILFVGLVQVVDAAVDSNMMIKIPSKSIVIERLERSKLLPQELATLFKQLPIFSEESWKYSELKHLIGSMFATGYKRAKLETKKTGKEIQLMVDSKQEELREYFGLFFQEHPEFIDELCVMLKNLELCTKEYIPTMEEYLIISLSQKMFKNIQRTCNRNIL